MCISHIHSFIPQIFIVRQAPGIPCPCILVEEGKETKDKTNMGLSNSASLESINI